MDNFKDPDESVDNGSVVSSEDNEVAAVTNGDTLDEENTESNGENTETNSEDTETNSENTESGSDETDEESVTDPEDEGISFDDIESDMEIEFKDCDNTFDQSLDKIVKNIVSETEKQLTAEIRSMREDVAESMRHLEESESLVNEVMKALEAQKVSPDGDPDEDEELESMTLESEVRHEEGMDTEDISPPSISPSPSPVKEPEKEKMTVAEAEMDLTHTSSTSTEVVPSLLPKQPEDKVDISSLNPNLLHSTLHNLVEPTAGAAKTAPVERLDVSAVNNSILHTDHPYQVNDKGLGVVEPNPPFQIQLQKRKAPVIVKKVSIPPRFEPLPTRRDPSTLQHPPIDPLIKFKPYEGAMVWAMSGSSLMDAWPEAKILKSVERSVGKGKAQEIQRQFQVIFTDDQTTKYLNSKQLAHHDELSTRIPVGERVIAVYKDEDQEEGDFFPAIVAEAPKEANKNRYLVFFDDGYATYLEHKDLRLVYTKDLDVWKDVDKGVRDFVKNYVQQFPKRAMITLKEGDRVRTELNGRIVEAEVTEVDASLVRMSFSEEICEWVYRGSLRFEPMTKLQETLERKMRKGDIKPVAVSMMEIQPYTQVY